MIKISYVISFTEAGEAINCFNLPPFITERLAHFRSIAADLGCTFDTDIDSEFRVITVTHLWPDQATLDQFLEVTADEMPSFMVTHQDYIASLGGTLVRTQE